MGYSYELEGPVQVKPEQGRTSQNRVRFQDPQSQDDAKISTIKRNGNIANNLNQTEKDNDKRALEEREREMKIEEKKKELEEKMKEEEKLLNEARKRAQIGPAGSNGSTPPSPSQFPTTSR